jgi:hypothetical protein
MKKIEVEIEFDDNDPYAVGEPYSAFVLSKKRKFRDCTIGKSIKSVKDQMRSILKKEGWKESEYRFTYRKAKGELLVIK